MDKNGATRLSKLHFVRLGAKGSSLRWKPVDVNTAAATSETAKFVNALVFPAASRKQIGQNSQPPRCITSTSAKR